MKKTVLTTMLLFVMSVVMTAYTGDYKNPHIDKKASTNTKFKQFHTSHQVWDKRNQESIDFYIGGDFIPVGNDFTKLRVSFISTRLGLSFPSTGVLEDFSDFIYPKVKGPVFNRTIEYVLPDRMDPGNKVIIVKLKIRLKVTDEGNIPNMQRCKGKVKYRNMNDKYRAMLKGNPKEKVFRYDEKGRLIDFELKYE